MSPPTLGKRIESGSPATATGRNDKEIVVDLDEIEPLNIDMDDSGSLEAAKRK